jgi:hypothetical protein
MSGFDPAPRLCDALLPAALLLLAGCASHPAATARTAATATDRQGVYRFEMTQDGRRMSADQFDAWMKANGIRVAKGAPAVQTAKLKPKAKAKPRRKSAAVETASTQRTTPAGG